MKMTSKDIKRIIKEEMTMVLEAYEITDLVGDLGSDAFDAPTTEKERHIDKEGFKLQEAFFDSLVRSEGIALPTGEEHDLESWFSVVGNMVATGGIHEKEALSLVHKLADAAGAALHTASAGLLTRITLTIKSGMHRPR